MESGEEQTGRTSSAQVWEKLNLTWDFILFSRQLLQGGGSQGCLNLWEQQRRRVSDGFLSGSHTDPVAVEDGGEVVDCLSCCSRPDVVEVLHGC